MMGIECILCNFTSPDNASECEVCGAKFEPAPTAVGKPKITLVSVIDGNHVAIPENGALIGRGGDIAPEIFEHKWVSENHCRITVDGNDCFVEDIGSEGNGSTNGTFIDGIKLPKRTPTKLYGGSKLKIAHLLFDVKVELPQSPVVEETAETAIEQLIWVIECPVSAKRFEVENSDAKIQECACCVDTVDKKRISKVKPKQVKR
jgi:hypothetical protein